MIQRILNPAFMKRLIVMIVALAISILIASWLLGIPQGTLWIYELIHIALFTLIMSALEMIYDV